MYRGLTEKGKWIYGDLMWHKRFLEEKPYIKESRTGEISWEEVRPKTVGRLAIPKDPDIIATQPDMDSHNSLWPDLWEGDVIGMDVVVDGKFVRMRFTVAWEPEGGFFFAENGMRPHRMFGLAELLTGDIEVIGNIHDGLREGESGNA